LLAFGFWVADVFLLNPDVYPSAFHGDAMATLRGVLAIGTFVGVAAFVILAIVFAVKSR
jgi:hypothetical protein